MTTRFIEWFVRRYGVNMQEAANPDVASYPTFNEFFTRPLKVGARPLAQADLVSPVDGAISQLGPIQRDQIFRPRGINTRPPPWWAVMPSWPPSFRMATLPPCT